MNNAEKIFQLLTADRPNPKSELRFENNFQLLIAVILSAQATDISVNKITPALFEAAPSPEDMIALGEKKIQHFIKSIGLSNAKAKNIYKCCQTLVYEYDSTVPDTRKDLEKLAGVGPKTAGVILNVAFNKGTIPVDTHVFRVANRTGLVHTKTPSGTESELMKIVPAKYLKKAHHLLILHGRYVCKARKPLCYQCSINAFCQYKNKTPAPDA